MDTATVDIFTFVAKVMASICVILLLIGLVAFIFYIFSRSRLENARRARGRR